MPAGLALVFGEREQEHLGGDELVAALECLLLGQVQQVHQLAAHLHLAASARHLRQALDGGVGGRLQRRGAHARAFEQRAPRPVGLAGDRRQQVHRLDVLVVVGQRETLCVGQGLLELGGELVEAHGFP